jgi:hypothetical protein
VPTSFRHERVKGRVRRRVEARANRLGLAEILAKNRSALLRADFAELDLFAASPPAEARLTGRTSIANPAHLAVGRNQPAVAVLDQDDGRGIRPAASSATHTKKVGVSPCNSDAEQALHAPIDQARRTRPIRHPSIIAPHVLSSSVNPLIGKKHPKRGDLRSPLRGSFPHTGPGERSIS